MDGCIGQSLNILILEALRSISIGHYINIYFPGRCPKECISYFIACFIIIQDIYLQVNALPGIIDEFNQLVKIILTTTDQFHIIRKPEITGRLFCAGWWAPTWSTNARSAVT